MNLDYYSVKWLDNAVSILDQTLLPAREKYLTLTDYRSVIEAIKSLRVRGAPAIGIAAAYACVLAARQSSSAEEYNRAMDELAGARPTAVNLKWAVDRMRRVLGVRAPDSDESIKSLLGEATNIHEEDAAMCEAMGRHGAELIPDGASILTHCNAGPLATGGIGTALSAILVAYHAGKRIKVYANETRPLLQGARLTMWELRKQGVDCSLMCDSAAAFAMSLGMIDLVMVGADRIARNGDVANKIGTLSTAIAASRYGAQFYVIAPSSTFDENTANGSQTEVEERSPEEIVSFGGVRTAPPGVEAFAPAFDITPAKLVTRIVTERGVFLPGEPLSGNSCTKSRPAQS